ncbi:MAG: hypothetical protein HQM12_07650 [SAR324 cluster bacterium]|nr:hypothetical protein [SAR324 cluster bacterium]
MPLKTAEMSEKELFFRVKSAFGWKCAACGLRLTRERAGDLVIHFIDLNSVNRRKDNLLALCTACHKQIDDEAQHVFSKHYCQGYLFKEYEYIEVMRQLLWKGLQQNLFDEAIAPALRKKQSSHSKSMIRQLSLFEKPVIRDK